MPIVLCGGCKDTNVKGREVENFISKQDLCLTNGKTHTYLHSSLDLTICSPEVAPDFIWKVDEDLHGSNHFPILASKVRPSV